MIEQGNVFQIDMFSLPLGAIAAPQKLMIILAIEGTNYRNDYNIWIYPPKVDTNAPDGVIVTDSLPGPKKNSGTPCYGRQGPAASKA